MIDVLTQMVDGLQQLHIGVTAEELCDALWLCQQGVTPSHPLGATAGIISLADPPGKSHRRTHGRPGRRPRPAAGSSHIYLPGEFTDSAGTASSPALTRAIQLPDAPALPHARALARTLRPLRYDPRQARPSVHIDEEETARCIARSRMRIPVPRMTRRRRLDLDLVLDLGGSGMLWTQLAAELQAMLEIHGAFRSVRPWVLDSDSAELMLRPRHSDLTGRGYGNAARYPSSTICQPPRKPIVIVLTDGTGTAWRTEKVHRPLREWAKSGTVLLIQLLPAKMWNQTALRAVPVTFFPANDGYHRGARLRVDAADLSVAGLDHDTLPAASAIPVIGLDVPWVRSWLPLLRGTEAGAVPGYALLIPAPAAGPGQPTGRAQPPARRLTPQQRVQRFGLIASRDARQLARLLSVGPFNLATMRKIQLELVPGSGPTTMAEVLLGGLLRWTSPTDTGVPADQVAFEFHPGVRALLQERTGGAAELARDAELVQRALFFDSGTGRRYGAVEVGPRGITPAIVPEKSLPVAIKPTPAGHGGQAGPDPAGASRVTEQSDEPDVTPVRVGIWGSTQSGRTTFLAVLGRSGWQSTRTSGDWHVVPADPATKHFIDERFEDLTVGKQFPGATLPHSPERLSFQLWNRRKGRGLMRWLRPQRLAEITVTLQDRSGRDFVGDSRLADAVTYLAGADALIYFFDPTYDKDVEARKWHSIDYFMALETGLGMSAATEGVLHQHYLPQHIAVCIPKLDDQHVFEIARRYGCVENEPGTARPWVPGKHAKMLFEAVCREQRTYEVDYLFERIRRTFHPDRTSFHALSSVGFWVPENGQFDPKDVCNLIEVRQEDPASSNDSPPARRVRGQINPVNILDPLIELVERIRKKADRP